MGKLQKFWHYLLLLVFRREPTHEQATEQPAPQQPSFESEKLITGPDARALAAKIATPLLVDPSIDVAPPATPDAVVRAGALLEPAVNRHARRKQDAELRKLERARMKHDVWVKPGGLEPVKHERESVDREPPPSSLPIVQDDFVDRFNQQFMADEWIEGDGGGDVLFVESEFYGTFNFRDTILEQLDRYWVYIERMKRHDPNAYGFYKQLGATLLPYLSTKTNWDRNRGIKKIVGEELEQYKASIKLSTWFKQHWPGFGCVCWSANPLDEEQERTQLGGNLWIPKFLYFTRISTKPWPWYVQPMRGGKLYELTVWFDRVDHPKTPMKWGVPNSFPIWISDDGNIIRALKTREASDGTIRSEYDWRIPHDYSAWAKQYGVTAQLHLTHLFANAIKDIEESYYSTCRVSVSKGDLTAVFGIEPQRVPYFFKDRDVTLDAHGRKQRVFHVVRPHLRSNGTAVPMQFRGLREFDWAGYHVSITVPGHDHLLLQEMSVPMEIMKPRSRVPRDKLREADVATWLKQKIKAGVGAFRR